jgi:hypothetical protein
VDALVAELLAFKRRRRGVITNSDYYLEQIPRYVRGEMTEPCRSGRDTVHVGPTGLVRRCPDFPADGHWREYAGYEPIACNACYYACRGEAQAPLRASRVADVMGVDARRPGPAAAGLSAGPARGPWPRAGGGAADVSAGPVV